LIKNGKLFLPPPRDGTDFKELFNKIAAAGAGRPLGKDGFPAGPWTPELLAEAISQIDANRIGVDLRTVQLWFQVNDKGMSTANMRWLARVLGCDDPEATSEWQMELSEAQSRLTAKRQEWKKAASSVAPGVPDTAQSAIVDDETESPTELARDTDAKGPRRRFSLARRSEALFSRGSPLDLPASVFAGATALGYLSYVTGIHNASYTRADGLVKQVGFLWAPNWTVLFLVFLPLFLAFVIDLLAYWKYEGRLKLVAEGDRKESGVAWARNIEASSITYWAVFIICVFFAGVFQWIGVRLIPLLQGGGNRAPDWGFLAIVRPEVISVPTAVVFTGLAFLYMCLSFYLFFAGLILLHTMVHDFWKIGEASKTRPEVEYQHEVNEVGIRVMGGILRCTVLGILIAICMKAQGSYLKSNAGNILAWLVDDLFSALYASADVNKRFSYRPSTNFSSLIIASSACFVFLYGSIRLGIGSRVQVPLWKMSAVVALLFASYLLINAFQGFSIILGIAVLLAIYGLINPGFGRWRASESGNSQNVS
jgi:hypothetical protein